MLLEVSDLDVIAEKTVELLKPVLASNRKSEDKDTIFNVKELANYMSVSIKWIYERTHLKEIPYLKIKGQLRFRKREIDKWLDTFKVPAVDTPGGFLKGVTQGKTTA